ncbi:MAG: recombinase family protein [Defluviitaleaceae bacterium]|nr:recombinase family protein [Defluviitaleaceae bacterium]
MLNTAIYVRVSTDEQAKEGYSIRAQIDKLKNYIEIKDWGLYKVYADEGISGKNISDRPAINELIDDIKSGKVNNVLVYKIDRLTRSTKDLIELTELFNNAKCGFNSLMESIDTQTASGRMFLKIIGIFAEFERENTIERVKLACEKKVKEGFTLAGSTMSYGYDRENGEKVQTINHEEAKIVREVYSMYLDGNMSYAGIARNLNHRGIKPKRGEAWHHASIRGILTNSTYIGKVRYALDDEERYFEADGKHEPIISEEIFYSAQKKMGNLKRVAYTKRPKEDNYFCGVLYCAECGARMQTNGEYKVNSKGEKIVSRGYRCPNISKGLCKTSRFSHAKIENAFEEYMDDIEDFTVTPEILPEEQSKRENINALLREEYENAIVKLMKREKELMNLYIGERISFEDYEQMITITRNEKNTYADQIINLPLDEEADEIELLVDDIVTNFRDNWQALTNSEKMQFLHNYIEQIMASSKKEEGYQVKVLNVKFQGG